jgi:multidrug efflux pump subunit AcrB
VGALYYRNRRLLALTVLLALVAGFSAWMTLPRREDPELTDRNAIVFTRYPGASAERVEALVTEKIEDELREIEEIRKLESSSRTGISVVAIELSDDITKTAEVWSRIRDKLDEAERRLPEGAETPELEEFTIDAYTVIGTLSWNLPGEPNHAVLRRLAEELEDVLRAVPGTKETDLFGEIPEEIRVEIDAEQLALRGLAASDVARAIRRSDAKVPAGQIRTERIEVPLEVRGELKQLDELRRVPVRYGAGDEVVRLEDVADIRKTIQDPPREMAIAFGRTAVAVAARMESTDRVDRWAAAVREKVSDWKTALPEGIQLDLVFDQSGYTETRLAGLLGNLGLGAALVILVLLVTMGWRSALLVGAALPLSSLMVLTGMMLLGIPLHQMSITGLIIALGLLIDNAIVMVDEVRHRLAAGVETAHAVAGAVRAMAVPLLSSTITTTLAFLPLLLGGGPTSEFVGPMSLSVILAIASSFFLALTVIPALAGMLVREGEGRRWWQAGLAPASAGRVYRRTLDFLLARPVVPILLALLLPVAGFGLASTLDQQFFPPSERDQFPLELRMPALSSIEQTRAQALAARELLLEHPRVTEVHWFLGSSAPKIYYNMIEGEDGSSEYAQAIVQLDREEGAVEVIRDAPGAPGRGVPGRAVHRAADRAGAALRGSHRAAPLGSGPRPPLRAGRGGPARAGRDDRRHPHPRQAGPRPSAADPRHRRGARQPGRLRPRRHRAPARGPPRRRRGRLRAGGDRGAPGTGAHRGREPRRAGPDRGARARLEGRHLDADLRAGRVRGAAGAGQPSPPRRDPREHDPGLPERGSASGAGSRRVP